MTKSVTSEKYIQNSVGVFFFNIRSMHVSEAFINRKGKKQNEELRILYIRHLSPIVVYRRGNLQHRVK